MSEPVGRREALRLSALAATCGVIPVGLVAGQPSKPRELAPGSSPPFLTLAKDFQDVSRGDPVPHSLQGEALAKARLTPETWRLEIIGEDKATVEKPLTLAAQSAIDLPALLKLGGKNSVRYLKAMQCNNIAPPLGQGLWEGVALRDVLKLCGKLVNPRRLHYWGVHNDKPDQMFRSSLAMNQVLDTPPGEMPPFLAYRLNGAPIPLARGGPVRMVVPWAHGFKSIKWLQNIVLTNNHAANDTYAQQNNDPESYLKTAAYLDEMQDESFAAGLPMVIRGVAMVGWPGLERVEYWLRPDTGATLSDDDPLWAMAQWQAGVIEPPPQDWGGGLPGGGLPRGIWGFTAAGKPLEWPMRFSVARWMVPLKDLQPGKYELRVRTVDRNGFAQPEPRPNQRSGKNLVQCKRFSVNR
ncbi:MAG: hypothetical protein DWH82_02670 [Planctomycetota bacterium]|nr:MAG: hypothetical protein DWH82_02670 [Planctomycetota bacterium]